MALTRPERAQMIYEGTELVTIADPVDYDHEDVSYPHSIEEKPEQPGVFKILVDAERPTEPLAAGFGRYMMIGACGNLKRIGGWLQCGIYDKRPQTCRDFKMGGPACGFFRQLVGLQTPGRTPSVRPPSQRPKNRR